MIWELGLAGVFFELVIILIWYKQFLGWDTKIYFEL